MRSVFPCPRQALAVVFVPLFVVWPVMLSAQTAPSAPLSLLVLLSGAPDNTLEMEFLKGLKNELRRAAPRPPVPDSLNVNFLELQRFRERPDYPAQLRKWLADKYQGMRFDAVVTNNLPALEFALAERELWNGTPLVFAGLQPAQVPRSGLPTQARGATVVWDIDGTIDLAQALLPRAQQAAIVFGRAPTELALAQQAREAFARRAPGMRLIELGNLEWGALMARVATMPQDSFILALGAAQDPKGRAIEQAHALRLGAQAANVPVFSLNEAVFPLGSVGGSLINYERIGEDAARRVLRLLSAPEGVSPVEQFHGTKRKVDATVLARWNIDEGRVPADVVIVNRVPTLWRDFRAQMISGILALSLLMISFVVLLVERQRRRHAERSASDRLAQLARMDRIGSMGQLAASLAHEINQPLGAVRNYTDGAERLLSHDPLPMAKLKQALTSIRKDSQRATDVIQTMHAMFRGKERPHRRLDINLLCAQTVDMVTAEAMRRGAALRADLPGVPVVIEGDDVQLQQLLVNLLLNALDATVPGSNPRVTVALTTDATHVRLTVTDNGVGIPAEHQARVFEPFFTTKSQGVGIGLTLVRHIVESHGGRIDVRDAAGGGTVMESQFPCAVASRGTSDEALEP